MSKLSRMKKDFGLSPMAVACQCYCNCKCAYYGGDLTALPNYFTSYDKSDALYLGAL